MAIERAEDCHDSRAVRMHGQWTVVLPADDLDPLTSPILGAQLEDLFSAGIHPVAVDWCEVTFFDSSAIGVLLQAHRAFTEADRRFAVISRVGTRSRLFEIMGLDQILTLVDSIDELDQGPRGRPQVADNEGARRGVAS